MTRQIEIDSKRASLAVAVLASCALILGCGGTKNASTTVAPESAAVAKDINHGNRPQPAGDQPTASNAAIASRNRAACEQAAKSAPALAPAAKSEIAALCFRMNNIPEDNEKTARAVCQEVANASALSSDAARKRTTSACYAVAMR
jgi:hypothetical protein